MKELIQYAVSKLTEEDGQSYLGIFIVVLIAMAVFFAFCVAGDQ